MIIMEEKKHLKKQAEEDLKNLETDLGGEIYNYLEDYHEYIDEDDLSDEELERIEEAEERYASKFEEFY